MPPVIPYIAGLALKATVAITGSQVAGLVVGKFVLAYGGKIALLGATMAYSSHTQRKAMKKMRASAATLNKGRSVMVRQAIYPRQIIYGQIRTSGPMSFIDETGTDNQYLNFLVSLAAHECEEITTVYFNAEALTLDGSGNVTSPSKYVGHARVIKHLGASTQVADADLVAESPRWSSAHRGRSVCYLYIRLKWDAEKFSTGWPNVSALVKGKKVYDSRTSTTAWSANWALCLADFLTDTRVGLGTNLADIDDTALQVAANICDESVTLNPSGTEARYTCNGQVGSDSTPGDVIEQLVMSAAGFCGYIGGKWVIHAGAYRTPTIALDEDDIRAPLRVQTKVSRAENFNAVKGVFMSPDNDWQPADYPAITNATYQTEDDGVRVYRDLEWTFVTSNATAQRLAKIALERVRQPITVDMSCKLTAMQVQAGDNVMLSIARFGWTNKVFEVVSAKFVVSQESEGQALGYDLSLRETAAAVWDWSNGEETTIDPAPNTNLPDPRVVAAPTSLLLESGASEIFEQVDGTVIPRIKATWTMPADSFVQFGGLIRIEFKRTSETEWLPWGTTRGDVVEDYLTDVESGIEYGVRVRAENTLRAVSAWVTDTITVGQKTSAPNAPTGVTLSSDGVVPRFFPGTEVFNFGCRVFWNEADESDFAYYEVKATFTNSDAAIDYTWSSIAQSSPGIARVTDPFVIIYNPVLQAGFVRVRAVDRTGNASAWTAAGSAASSASIGTGDIASQDSDDVSTSGISTGQSGAPTKILTRHSAYSTKTLAGGAPTEAFDISLTGLGFSTSPDGGAIQCNNVNLVAGYNKGDGASSSTNARCFVATIDGTNIPAGTYGVNIILEEN